MFDVLLVCMRQLEDSTHEWQQLWTFTKTFVHVTVDVTVLYWTGMGQGSFYTHFGEARHVMLRWQIDKISID